MILMLTYRCSLDCDHCMIYATGPKGEHMSEWVLKAAVDVFCKTRSNQLGLAGGEPLEHPAFWDILATLRRAGMRRGFAIKVATSGEPFDKDPALIEKAAKSYPVTFQVTRTPPFYKRLHTRAEVEGLPNVYFHRLDRYYHSRKAQEREFDQPECQFRRQRLYCEPAWWLRRATKNSLNFGAFIRQWEGYKDLCTIHVDPQGEMRMGPLDICRSLGNVIQMEQDFVAEGRRAMVAMGEKPCRKCGLKGKIK